MIKAWRNLFRPHILERGLNYYEEGAITALEKTENGYKAIVEGSDEYSVEIIVGNGGVDNMFCDCPYADDGNYCKHMAAVLYAIEAESSAMASEKSVYEQIRESRQELESVIEKIPVEQLRQLAMSLAENDTSLRNRVMTQYSEQIDERQLIRLKMEVDRIAYENSDRGGFVDYYHSSDYVDAMNEVLDENVQLLMDKAHYMQAFDLTSYVFCCVGNQAMDDSDGGSSRLANKCYDFWKKILDKCSEAEREQMLQWFKEHREGYVIDYMEEYISDFLMDEFHDEQLLRQKLAYLDEAIQRAGSNTNSGSYYSVRYGFVTIILQRLQVMEQLGYSEQEIKEYRHKFRQFSDIRKLEIQEYLDGGDYQNAILVLKESKELDAEYQGLVSEYSRRLIDIYEKIGDMDTYRKELEYQIFDCLQSDLVYVNKLKELCWDAEWEVYREQILESNKKSSIRYALLEAEGLYERLLEEVTAEEYLMMLDKYEKVLKKVYPERLRDAYISLIRKEADRVCDRKQYHELVKYLKKLARYPGGQSCVREVAAEWRVLYRRRPAMMDELKKAGV